MESLNLLKDLKLNKNTQVYSGGELSRIAAIYTGMWGTVGDIGRTNSSYWFEAKSIFSSCSHPYVHIPRLESTPEFQNQSVVTRSFSFNSKTDDVSKVRPPPGKSAWPIIVFSLDDDTMVVFDIMFNEEWKPDNLRMFHHNTIRLLTLEEHQKAISGEINVCNLGTLFVCQCCGHV